VQHWAQVTERRQTRHRKLNKAGLKLGVRDSESILHSELIIHKDSGGKKRFSVISLT
jgi:hypothetical protein